MFREQKFSKGSLHFCKLLLTKNGVFKMTLWTHITPQLPSYKFGSKMHALTVTSITHTC